MDRNWRGETAGQQARSVSRGPDQDRWTSGPAVTDHLGSAFYQPVPFLTGIDSGLMQVVSNLYSVQWYECAYPKSPVNSSKGKLTSSPCVTPQLGGSLHLHNEHVHLYRSD
jgi:hypothetical protein